MCQTGRHPPPRRPPPPPPSLLRRRGQRPRRARPVRRRRTHPRRPRPRLPACRCGPPAAATTSTRYPLHPCTLHPSRRPIGSHHTTVAAAAQRRRGGRAASTSSAARRSATISTTRRSSRCRGASSSDGRRAAQATPTLASSKRAPRCCRSALDGTEVCMSVRQYTLSKFNTTEILVLRPHKSALHRPRRRVRDGQPVLGRPTPHPRAGCGVALSRKAPLPVSVGR